MRNIKFLTAALSVAAAVSCSDGICRIEGSFEDQTVLESKEVYFISSGTETDTVAVVDGKFEYSCPVDESKMMTVLYKLDDKARGKKLIARVIPDSKAVSVVLGKESEVTGSPLTDKFNQIMEEAERIAEEKGEDAWLEYSKGMYVENSKSVVGENIFMDIVWDLSLEEMDEYLEKGSDKLKSNPKLERIRNGKVAAQSTGVGAMYLDFSGVSPDGVKLSLSDFVGKGKLTLVDFWASWCGPCMRSMPGMVNLWNKWHSKGLNIVGVAVWDGDNSASREKIVEKGMLWPQIFVGDDKSATDSYGILGIPHVLLLDADGKILMRGIPDEEEIDKMIGGILE